MTTMRVLRKKIPPFKKRCAASAREYLLAAWERQRIWQA